MYFSNALNRMKTNRDSFMRFDRHMVIEGLKLRRRLKYLRLFSTINRLIKKDMTELNGADVESFILHLRGGSGRKYSEDTKDDYYKMFNKILKFFNKKNLTRKYKLRFSKKIKSADEILTREEIELMMKYCQTSLEKATVSTLFNMGARPEEFLGLKKPSVKFDELGMTATVNGKTGERTVRVIEIIDGSYLREHADSAAGEYLFDFTETQLNTVLKDIAARAGICKRMYTYLFRHSSITFTGNLLTESQQCAYYGWVQGSKMPRTYNHLTGRSMMPSVIEINERLRARMPATANANMRLLNYNNQPQTVMQNDPLFAEFQKWKARQPTLANSGFYKCRSPIR